MNKKAFTIAEMLVVLSIVALIAILMITTLRPYIAESVLLKQYYRAYTILHTAVYNNLADVIEHNQERREIADANNAAVTGTWTFPSTPAALCEALVSKDTGYINTIWANCSKIIPAGADIGSLVKDKTSDELRSIATFKATNEMYFYIQPIKIGTSDFNIIWVDINGNKPPNSTTPLSEKKPADIVPFLVSERGILVPAGIPIYDSRYMTATVRFSDPEVTLDYETVQETEAKTAEEIQEMIDKNTEDGKTNPSEWDATLKNALKPAKRTFAEAKLRAFGSTFYPLDDMSVSDPFSVSGDIKSKSDSTVTVHPFCPSRGSWEYPSCSVRLTNPDNRIFRNFRTE